MRTLRQLTIAVLEELKEDISVMCEQTENLSKKPKTIKRIRDSGEMAANNSFSVFPNFQIRIEQLGSDWYPKHQVMGYP